MHNLHHAEIMIALNLHSDAPQTITELRDTASKDSVSRSALRVASIKKLIQHDITQPVNNPYGVTGYIKGSNWEVFSNTKEVALTMQEQLTYIDIENDLSKIFRDTIFIN